MAWIIASDHCVWVLIIEQLVPLIETLVTLGVPVCAHLGLTPQSVHALGGYRVQATTDESTNDLINTAISLARAGAAMLLVECIPNKATERLMEAVSLPVIGIGAGPDCSGQILVIYDILDIPPGPKARFVKNYLALTTSIPEAMHLYQSEVRNRQYPAPEHCFDK